VLSDWKVLIGADILQGIGLIQDLITEYSLEVVQAYMDHIQACV